MALYTLDDKMYEIFPQIKRDKPALTPRQLRKVAEVLSEHFGCFLLFGISLQGEPQVLLSGSSGLEHLALKKFAEDLVKGEAHVSFTPLNDVEE